jgi:hypothetical protein
VDDIDRKDVTVVPELIHAGVTATAPGLAGQRRSYAPACIQCIQFVGGQKRWCPVCCKYSMHTAAMQLEAVGTTRHLRLVVLIAIPAPSASVVKAVEVAGRIVRMRH